MTQIKFLLDENGDPSIISALRQQAPSMEVGRIGDPGKPALGSADPDILVWCEANEYALITNDRVSMPVHLRDHLLARRHVPGILVLDSRMTMRQTIDSLLLIWGASDAEEYRDRLVFMRSIVSIVER